MPVNVSQQTLVFFACILTGIISGIFCDVLSITAKKLRFKKSAVFVQDILIWFVILAFFFTVIYKINGAVLRWYVFLGAAFGAVIYILLLRLITIKITSAVIGFVCKIIKKILIIVSFPVRRILRLLRPLAGYVQNIRKKKDIFVQKNIEKMRRIRILLKKV